MNDLKSLEAVRVSGRKGERLLLPDNKKREIKFLYDEQNITGKDTA